MTDPIPKQKFTGYWIPAELSEFGLTKIEQFLLSMIDSLTSPAPDFCFASNTYLAEQMDLSESRVSFYITKFKRMGLVEQVGYDGRRRRLRTLKENWYKTPLDFSKKELCVKTRSQTTRKQEVRVRENANHIKKSINKEDIIIEKALEPRENDPPPKSKDMPAGGNNKFFECLKKCEDLSDSQKRLLMKYPEPQVEQAIRYCYHPATQIKGGPIGRIKLLQYFLQNPENFKDKLENLDKPHEKLSKKDILIGRFKRGEIYNGYEFLQDDIGVGFYKPGMMQPYSVRHDARNFAHEFLELLKKLKLD